MNRDMVGSLYKLKAEYSPNFYYKFLLVIGLHPKLSERIIIETYDKGEVINLELTFDDLYKKYERVG